MWFINIVFKVWITDPVFQVQITDQVFLVLIMYPVFQVWMTCLSSVAFRLFLLNADAVFQV